LYNLEGYSPTKRDAMCHILQKHKTLIQSPVIMAAGGFKSLYGNEIRQILVEYEGEISRIRTL
jgi:hypothetical protein